MMGIGLMGDKEQPREFIISTKYVTVSDMQWTSVESIKPFIPGNRQCQWGKKFRSVFGE